MEKILWSLFCFGVIFLINPVNGVMEDEEMELFTKVNGTKLDTNFSDGKFPVVPLTLVESAAAKGAVCMDGSVPGYHLHRGFGPGADNWLVQMEGGGWCDTIRNCKFRAKSRLGSSKFMEKNLTFMGILSDEARDNPDFYNWNRVKIRYCDGGSYSGDSEDKAANLQFRGKKVWLAVMEDLMAKGMRQAKQALLSGCSAGGLGVILRCDDFGAMFPPTTKVKCLSDAGIFLDALDVSGGRSLRRLYSNVVKLQNLQTNLPKDCLNRLKDPISCFFPQNLINQIKTPMFLLNTAYDSWQIRESLSPKTADPSGSWNACRLDYSKCNATQIQFLSGFRTQMVDLVNGFAVPKKNGMFLNSCFAHCQTEKYDTWFGKNAPAVQNKGIAVAVGDWYFERAAAKLVDCAYPCDMTCHNLVYKG